jgi:hypothetical protein
MPNIKHSIQEYCKKINSRITIIDIASIAISALGLFLLYFYLLFHQKYTDKPIIYEEYTGTYSAPLTSKALPFASVSGKTYTFSWCSGASRISDKHKIFFPNEESAKASGRYISKSCQK